MHNEYLHISTRLVLEFSNHITETFGTSPNFGVVEPILDVHGNSFSIF